MHFINQLFSTRTWFSSPEKQANEAAGRIASRVAVQKPALESYQVHYCPAQAATVEQYKQWLFLYPGEITESSEEEARDFVENEKDNALHDFICVEGVPFYHQAAVDMTRTIISVNGRKVYRNTKEQLSCEKIAKKIARSGNISVTLVNESLKILAQGSSCKQTGHVWKYFMNQNLEIHIFNRKRMVDIDTTNPHYLILKVVDIWHSSVVEAYLKSLREFVALKSSLENRSGADMIGMEYYSPWFPSKTEAKNYHPIQAMCPSGIASWSAYQESLLKQKDQFEIIRSLFIKDMLLKGKETMTTASQEKWFLGGLDNLNEIEIDGKIVYHHQKRIGPLNVFQRAASNETKARLIVSACPCAEVLRVGLVAGIGYVDRVLEARLKHSKLKGRTHPLCKSIEIEDEAIKVSAVYKIASKPCKLYLGVEMRIPQAGSEGLLYLTRCAPDANVAFCNTLF